MVHITYHIFLAILFDRFLLVPKAFISHSVKFYIHVCISTNFNFFLLITDVALFINTWTVLFHFVFNQSPLDQNNHLNVFITLLKVYHN